MTPMAVRMKPCEAWVVFANATGEVRYIDIREHVCDGWCSGNQSVARVLITEGWRPIAEAGRGPNDFWWAFCPMPWRCPAEYRQIYWCDGRWVNAENDEPLKYQPTHFMPLPAPPTEVKRG